MSRRMAMTSSFYAAYRSDSTPKCTNILGSPLFVKLWWYWLHKRRCLVKDYASLTVAFYTRMIGDCFTGISSKTFHRGGGTDENE